jgi:hypothetical protein
MASGETEYPQDVTDGFAVGIAVGHKIFSLFGSDSLCRAGEFCKFRFVKLNTDIISTCIILVSPDPFIQNTL